MVYDRNLGDGITFREVYEQSFDGSTSYSYKSSYLSNCNQFSLYLDIVPTVDSSRRVIFSFGDKNLSSVLFEIGISTNNKIFFYDGTTETEADIVLTSGVNYKIVVVYYSGGVVLYVNNLITNINFTNTLNGVNLIIGESVDGLGEFYEGYLNSVNLFINFHDVYEVINVSEITGLTFNPSTIPGLQVWIDPLNVASRTMGAAPDQTDLDAEAVGFAAWTLYNEGEWTLSKSGDAYEGSQSMLATRASGTTLGLIYKAGNHVVGNRYHTTARMKTSASSGCRFKSAGAQVINSGEHGWDYNPFDVEGTENSADRPYCYFDSVTVGATAQFDAITDENLSLTAITPRAGALASAFSQATATKQPWIDSTTGAIRFDGTADVLTYAGTASDFSFLHTGDMTLFAVADFDGVENAENVLGTFNTDGIIVRRYDTSANVQVYITNDSGNIRTQSTSNPISGDPQILETYTSGATNYLIMDGTLEDSTAFTADAGAGVAALEIGDTAGATHPFGGTIGDILAFNRALSATERTRLRNYLAAKWSITLP